MKQGTSSARFAWLLLLLPGGALFAQEAPASQAIPGLRGAALSALAAFPWAPVLCTGPAHATLDPEIPHVGSADTTIVASIDLAHLGDSPYQWHLAPFRSVRHRAADTLTFKAASIAVSRWPAPVGVPDSNSKRVAARERWNAAIANGDTLATLFITFDGCWFPGSEGSSRGIGAIALRWSASRWEIIHVDVGQP